MAPNLKTLIKYRDQILDDKRRALGELLSQEASLEANLKSLNNQLHSETDQDLSGLPPQAMPDFIEGVRIKSALIHRDLSALTPQILALREEVAEAFRDKKQIEIVEDQRREAAESEVARREVIELDEIANIKVARQRSLDVD